MMDTTYALRLRYLLSSWSDRLEKPASTFADEHRDLYPRRITNAQLYGLQNVVRNARGFGEIRRFIQHQGDKANRAGRWDVKGYWDALLKTLSGLKSEAQNLQQQVALSPIKENTKSVLDDMHRRLVEEFIQHLIAHSLYWTPERE